MTDTLNGNRLTSSDDAVNMMLYGIAHEMRNHVVVVMVNAAISKREAGDNRSLVERLEAVESAAENLEGLILRMLELGRGPRVSHAGDVAHLNPIAYHVLLKEEHEVSSRVRIVRYIDPDLWNVSASTARLAEVALILARNALEAVPGEGRVIIGTRNVTLDAIPLPGAVVLPPGPYVTLFVEDSGPRIPEETMGHLFDPGFTTKQGHKGGSLARARKIVEEFGGVIHVKSREGRGTTFTMYLPALEEVVVEQAEALQSLPRGQETVLVVDDERMFVDAMQQVLTRLGYRILVAYDGKQALLVANTHQGPIDAVLLDVAMPVMSGAEALPLLRKARPDARFIMCSGLDEQLISADLLAEGANGILSKPFAPTQLAQVLRGVLDRKPV